MKVQTSILVVRVANAAAMAGLFLMQGCQTTKPEQDTVKVEHMKTVMPPSPLLKSAPPVVSPKITPPMTAEAVTSYVVQKGDTLSGIAKRIGVSTRQLMEQNKLANANQVRVGQDLKLPGEHALAASPTASHATASKVTPRPGAEKYVVRKGDSISKIAARHGTTVKALRETNKLSGDNIMIGQVLYLPEGAALKKAGTAATTPASAKHASEPAASKTPAVEAKSAPAKPVAVSHAKTASTAPTTSTNSTSGAKAAIARPAAVARPAGGAEPSVTGTAAKPSAGTNAPAAPTAGKAPADGGEYITHTVAAGEDVFDVALKYTVLPDEVRRLNNLTGNELKEGDKLKIKVAGPAN